MKPNFTQDREMKSVERSGENSRCDWVPLSKPCRMEGEASGAAVSTTSYGAPNGNRSFLVRGVRAQAYGSNAIVFAPSLPA